MSKSNSMLQGFLDRIKSIISSGKDRIRDIELIAGFEKNIADSEIKKARIKQELDDLDNSFKVQVAHSSIHISKGDKSEFLIDNLKFIREKKDRIEKSYLEDLKNCVIEINNLNEKYQEFKDIFIKSNPFKYTDHLKNSLNKKRDQLPQISENDIDSFLLHFSGKSKGAKVTKVKVKLDQLKPTQNEFDDSKIITGLTNNSWKDRIYIISKDNYLLDGHHSWATGLDIDPETEVSCYRVNLPIKELLRRSNLLKISTKKDINGNIIKSMFSDFIESDEDFIDILNSNQIVITANGYNSLLKGEVLSYDDLLVGPNENFKKHIDEFQKDVKFFIKGDSTDCIIFYTLNNFEKSEIIESVPTKTRQKKESKPKKVEEVVEKGVDNSEVVSSKIYTDVIIQDAEGKVLFLKRSNNDTFGSGTFALPGGKVEDGESLEDAVKRELKEETGLSIKNVKFIKNLKNTDTHSESNYFYADLGSNVNESVILDDKEHDNYIWADRDAWNDLDLLFDLKERMNAMVDDNDIIVKSEEDKIRHLTLVKKGNELIKSFDSIISQSQDKSDAITELEKSGGYFFDDYPKPIKMQLENLLNSKF